MVFFNLQVYEKVLSAFCVVMLMCPKEPELHDDKIAEYLS